MRKPRADGDGRRNFGVKKAPERATVVAPDRIPGTERYRTSECAPTHSALMPVNLITLKAWQADELNLAREQDELSSKPALFLGRSMLFSARPAANARAAERLRKSAQRHRRTHARLGLYGR
jgi:hypothetical protein